MKKYLFAALALTALVACSKDPIDDVLTSSEKSVFISIANMASDTRATGGITGGNADDVACATNTELVFLFADKDGNILKKKAWNEGVDGTNPATIRAFHRLPEQVTQVAVIAHYAAYADDDFDNLSDAVNAWETQTDAIVAGELSSVVVYGVDNELSPNGTCTVDGDTYAKMEASVTVAPHMSRIEIGQIACTDLGTKYSKIGLENISFATGAYTYKFADAFANDAALDSADANVVLDSSSDTYSLATDVLSWNITPQPVSDMILNMHVVGNGYTVQIPKKTVTINSYKSNKANQNDNDNGTDGDTTDDTMTKFNSGQIYKINFNFSENNIDNNDILCVDVTVTIANWVVNTITPGFATK